MVQTSENMKQATDGAAILIAAKADSSQTMVKLCKNGNEWLSPTGWSKAEKSTLLDSDNEGDLTRFTIPDTFASGIKSGDTIKLTISSMGFEETMDWTGDWTGDRTGAETSTAATIGGALAGSSSKSAKRGLFGRFSGGRKADMPQQSEIERLAEEARTAAEVSSAEMRRAHEAKQAAEQRALEAARLAEAAHKMEQERILDADRATKALAKAEAAKLAEEKRIEAERLAEEARLVEEARLAELARIAEEKRLEAERKAEEARLAEEARIAEQQRLEQAARDLDAERLADIKRLNGEIADTKGAILSYEDAAKDLNDRAKRAKNFVKSQSEIEAQAKRTFEMAERKVSEGEAELAKRLQAEQTAKDELKRVEKSVSEQQKLSNKAASAAQKAQSAFADAELAAQAAMAKANELRIASGTAQDEAKALQRSLSTYQQQAQDLGAQKDNAETAGTAARSSLEQVRDTLGAAKGSLKDASSIHAEAGNAMRQTDGLISENQAELQKARDLATKMRAKVKHLKAQKITPDNVSEMSDILKMDPEMSAGGLKRAAALTSGLGGAALIMNAEESTDGVMSKLKGLFSRGNDEIETISDEAELVSTAKAEEAKFQEAKVQEAKVQEVSTEDVAGAVLEKKNIPTPDELVADDEPVVKLVSETDESDLEKPELNNADEDTDEEAGGISRKAVMGLSAVLLLSVASIGVIATNASNSKPITKANTEKTRITPQAVLPATVTAKEIIPAATDITAPVLSPTLEAPIDAVLENSDVKEIAPVALVAENTALPELSGRTWGDGTINLDSAAKTPAIKKPVRVAARTVPKRRVPARKKPVSVAITAAPVAIIAEPAETTYSDVTKDVQTKLATLGFYNGEATGRLDAATISSMNNFQKIFGQAETQIITPALLAELNNTKIVEAPLVPEPEIVEEETPTLEASLTPAEVKVEIPAKVEPEIAPELIVEAKKTKVEAARYPAIAERRGHNEVASVLVSYNVDADGKVINAFAKESSGVGRYKKGFERAAIKAAEKAVFSAKTIDGKAVVSEDHKTKFTFNVE